MSKIVDVLGVEIKVGDIVVATQNSTLWKPFHVVTRLGAKGNAQVNGCSYVDAGYLLVVNEQYTLAKGEQDATDLRKEYEEFFNEEPVQDKKPSPKFLVYRIATYCNGSVSKNPRYFVLKVQGNNQECFAQMRAFADQHDFKRAGEFHCNRNLNSKRNLWVHGGLDQAMTRKALVELGLENCIDSEILPNSPEFNIVENFKFY